MNNENNVLNEKSTSVKSKIEEAVRMTRQRLLDLTLNNRLLNYRPSRRRTIQIEHLAKQVETAKIRFVQKRAALFNHLGTDANALFGVETKKVSFTELRSRLELWEQGLTRLRAWEQFVRLCDACQQTIAQPLIELIASKRYEWLKVIRKLIIEYAR